MSRPRYPAFELYIAAAALAFFLAMWFTWLHQQTAARISVCDGHLHKIALALKNYRDDHGHYPPAYVADPAGTPMHSWRVLILPYLSYEDLYSRYSFSEPWDGPNNRLLGAEMPTEYSCVLDGSTTPFTTYLAVVKNGKTGGCSEIDNQLLLLELSERKVHWMSPSDVDCGEAERILSNSCLSAHSGGRGAVRCNGDVIRLRARIPDTMKEPGSPRKVRLGA